jgi:outer membrane protein OmpA-like peptidoglycan-associated protein
MKRHLAFALVSASVIVVTGCSKETAVYRSFYSEAGSELETADFAHSTRNNTMIQSGEQNFAIDLTRRFAADVPNTVNFAFNSWALDQASRQALLQQADWIKQFPEARLRIYGHTDLVGSDGYNKALGLRRAQAVVSFLVSQGISRSRLEAVASFGKTQPVVFVQGPERKNRRTVTEISGFVHGSPLVLNGKYAAIIQREYIASAVPPQAPPPASTGGTASGT